MAAVHSATLPDELNPLSSNFAKLTTDVKPMLGLRATTAPIVDPEAIRKALFETAYEPSEKLWADSQAAYVKPENDPLPEGFPEEAVGPTVWDGKELIKKPELWLHEFTKEELEDIDNAIKHFISLDLPFSAIKQETFPLTVAKDALLTATKEIHQGIGLRVLRGLPVQKYDRKSQIIAFAGIASYIGSERNRQGSTAAIAHLRDLTHLPADDRPEIVVKGQTAGNQVFHTDAGDIVGLLTLDRAAKGGLSQLSSIGQFYNKLAKSRRDILRTLADKKWKAHYDPVHKSLIHYVDGKVFAAYGRRGFFSFFEDQSHSAPLITPEQHLALDALHFTAESSSLDIDLQPGDLEFFNNLQVFHARTASEDDEEHQRHLLRIWVRNPELALNHGPQLDRQWNSIKADPEIKETWPLEAWDKLPREA